MKRGAVKMPLRAEGVAHPAGATGSVERVLAPPGRRQILGGLIVAALGAVLVTLFSARFVQGHTAIPSLLYLLVVVAAAAVGRLWPALIASALSFVCLDYFFTPPVHTFTVGKAEDLFALAVFFVVAAVVSTLISTALEQGLRAEFREHQVRALYLVTSRLLSGQDLDDVLRDLAASLRSLYGLARCRVVLSDASGTPRERAASGPPQPPGIPALEVPLRAGGLVVGRIEMWGASAVGPAETRVLETFAGQLALEVGRTRLRDEAEAARVEAESSRARAALFSSVTHDLRTPLASITAAASSLLEPGVPFSDEQREELLRTILEESERLNRLVANLMDLSRLRAGALTPTTEPVGVEDLVSSVLGRLRSLLAGRPITVRIREDLPPVPMDVVQMDQVLTNLVENAARYSAPGSPLSITAVRWQDRVEVRVADRGPGIAQEDRDRVFDEFFRRDVGEARGGTGLGLAIAHAVVAAHGGSIWIEETPGGGATVGLRLPTGRGGGSG